MPITRLEVGLIEKVFFLGMMQGYVGAPKKSKIDELSGSKLITFEYDENGYHFDFKDLYLVTKLSDYSSGITEISCDGEPAWSMTYGGKYPKEIIPFLKKALSINYSKNVFNGGRGPSYIASMPEQHDPLNLVYTNRVDRNGFSHFHGSEAINDNNGKILGWHRYQGNLMLPD